MDCLRRLIGFNKAASIRDLQRLTCWREKHLRSKDLAAVRSHPQVDDGNYMQDVHQSPYF
jgi:hypothetical protein